MHGSMLTKGEESRVAASCPGFASYEVRDNGIVFVGGGVPTFAEGSSARQKLVEAWERFQSPVARASRRTGIPAPWLMGIMLQESGGNTRACSPCSICRSELCESAAGMSCCAFGLMQFMGPVAGEYGTSPDEIVRRPELAIEVAAELLADKVERHGFDLPKIAAAYNAGSPRCSKPGTTFGWITNDDYPMKVVRYSNTAFELGMTKASSLLPALLFAATGAAVGWAIYTDRIRI